jgi:hypothetical protein
LVRCSSIRAGRACPAWTPSRAGNAVRATALGCAALGALAEGGPAGRAGPLPGTRRAERCYQATTAAFARRCGARNGDLLAHISTADTVRDLDRLRRLVGDRRLTFFGVFAAPRSARPMRTCSPAACPRWFSTASSIRSPRRPGPPRSRPAASPTPTACSTSSWPCASAPGRPVARSPAPSPRTPRKPTAPAVAPRPPPSPSRHAPGRLTYREALTAYRPGRQYRGVRHGLSNRLLKFGVHHDMPHRQLVAARVR